MNDRLDKMRADHVASDEAIMYATGLIAAPGYSSPGHLNTSFLDGQFRDRRPSPSSFSLDED